MPGFDMTRHAEEVTKLLHADDKELYSLMGMHALPLVQTAAQTYDEADVEKVSGTNGTAAYQQTTYDKGYQ